MKASLVRRGRELADVAPAFAGAAIVGYLFMLAGIAAPWISGGMIGALATAAIRPLPHFPVWLQHVGMLFAGVSMGSGVTPETLALMAKFPLSFVLLAAGIVAIIATSALWLIHVHGWSRDDATLASTPGALSTVLAISASRGGDTTGVAVLQTIRLIFIIALLPPIIGFLDGGPPGGVGTTQAVMGSATVLAVLAAGLAVGLLFGRLGLSAPVMLGGALVSSTTHGGGWVHGALPPVLAIGGFLLIGVMVASRSRGLSLRALADYFVASLAVLVISGVVAVLFAVATSAALTVRPSATLLAFAPGGVEAITVLAAALAYEPLYVGAHHIARVLLISFCLPLWFRLLDRGRPPPLT
jgi:membrane AbrB-like protein